MLDINYIRTKADFLRQSASNKQLDPAVIDNVLAADDDRRALLGKVEALRAQANELQRSFKGRMPTEAEKEQGTAIKLQLKELEPQLREAEEAFREAMLWVPNPASDDTPVGKDENENVVVKTVGEPKQFDFKPLQHADLMEKLGGIDTQRAAKVAGSRAYYLKGDIMLLEQDILQLALRLMVEKGFTPMSVPWMVNEDAFVNTGYGPWGLQDIFRTTDGQGMIGTAEVPLTAYLQDETLREKDLPMKLVGLSPCFRREVGSYGKDTKGVFRVHQFMKVEQVVLTIADEEETRRWHDQMLGYAEELLTLLELPYHVLLMCTGDMGAGQRRKYDIEVWFPSEKRYRETHSDSYFNDFQARRLNIRYQAKDGSTKYVYTLNNTVAATPRLLAAVLENHQQADGSVKLPAALGGRTVLPQ